MDADLLAFGEDLCRHCGAHVGYGAVFLHLNCCDDCRDAGLDIAAAEEDP